MDTPTLYAITAPASDMNRERNVPAGFHPDPDALVAANEKWGNIAHFGGYRLWKQVGQDGDRKVWELVKTVSNDPRDKLIAELVAALEAVLKLHIAHHNEPVHAAARAAIAKAEARK